MVRGRFSYIFGVHATKICSKNALWAFLLNFRAFLLHVRGVYATSCSFRAFMLQDRLPLEGTGVRMRKDIVVGRVFVGYEQKCNKNAIGRAG